ncbi:amino acid deaminase/aldolase [Promicromonospora kroppenstedtii]|uniref:Amino acid deaminase/aldolase n=1 Tax=Promicromonospora kroppenstedtii TaxID=440482 RepID=A0ABW7XR99_9MICO
MSSAADTAARLSAATSGLPAPVAVVDLDVFDTNALDILKRADGMPVRVASKSVRVRSLVDRALGHGFAGVMAYSLREALWLVGQGTHDVLVGYPTVDREALAALAADATARAEITLMVDDVAHLGLIAAAEERAGAGGPEAAASAARPVQVCLDVDCSLRVGAGPLVAHLGVRRSPLREPGDVAALATVAQAKGLAVRGLMFYEAQVAGLPDTSPAVRVVKRLTMREVNERRVRILAAVRDAVGHEVELVNAGGTGSIEVSGSAPGVTEVTSGSGLFVPGLFDGYRSFEARPAAFFGLDVVREPAPGWVTAFAGGYAASGQAGTLRLPRLFTPGYTLSGTEGAGEVQTPLKATRAGGGMLRTGDRVWLRHAKAGEMMERFDQVHLVRGSEITETVPTYRGEGRNFG